ncbi:unnamed protein product, partial [Prorocentrum cordatum]
APVVSEYAKWALDRESKDAPDRGPASDSDADGPSTGTAGTGEDASTPQAERDLEDAKSAYLAASAKAKQARADKQELDKNAKLDFGDDFRWISLVGACPEKPLGEYTYKVCFFGEARQDRTLLGRYAGWDASDPMVMTFAKGSSCPGGTSRALRVRLECAASQELLSVTEPDRCSYEARLGHPAACTQEGLGLLQAPASGVCRACSRPERSGGTVVDAGHAPMRGLRWGQETEGEGERDEGESQEGARGIAGAGGLLGTPPRRAPRVWHAASLRGGRGRVTARARLSGTAEAPPAAEEQQEQPDVEMEQVLAAVRADPAGALPLLLAERERASQGSDAAGARGAAARAEVAVHPHARAHVVSITASEELPFDTIWPMVRDDIMEAVREVCRRGHQRPEGAICADVLRGGSGAIAERLTLEEAETLAARLGHVVQTVVSVDPAAAQEPRRERAARPDDGGVRLGSRAQFAAESTISSLDLRLPPLRPLT